MKWVQRQYEFCAKIFIVLRTSECSGSCRWGTERCTSITHRPETTARYDAQGRSRTYGRDSLAHVVS